MGKRFKKRFSSLCCCRENASDASALEVKDVKVKTSNQRTCQPAISTADANRLFLKQTERRLMSENMFLKKLENLHECLDESVIDLGCKLKGIIRMDKAILQRYVEIMSDFVITQGSADKPTKVEDNVRRKELVNEMQLKDFNNVLTVNIRRETKALLFDIQKRNKDQEKRFIDTLQGHNLSTNASVPLMGAEMETIEAFSHTYPMNDSPLKYRELTPRIDAVNHFSQTIHPSRYCRKTENSNLNIYNLDDNIRGTEYTPTKPNLSTVVTLPVKYETHQTLECARYMSQSEMGFYNPPSSQENNAACVLTTLGGIANNYTVMVVREENEGLHLPVNTSGHRSCLQGPVWVFSFTHKTRILHNYQHQELESTMGNKKHVATVCVKPTLTRRIDKYGIIKREARTILNQEASFTIHSTPDGIANNYANNYTVMVVRVDNEGLHLPVNTSGQQPCLQGPVWVFSFTPKTRILHNYQHQELVSTMDIKEHVITICVGPLLTRRLDQYGLIKGEARAIWNQAVPFWIENPSVSTLPFAPASVGYKFTEFVLRRQGIMQVETSPDLHRKQIFQTEELTDQVFSLAIFKVAMLFTYDEKIIPMAMSMIVHKIISQRKASLQISGPSRNVHKVVSNEDSTDAVTHLVAPLLHSTKHTKNKREKLKHFVMISTVRSLKELCQMVSDKITTPKPRQSENMVKQCSTYPGHTDQDASKDLAANVASSGNKTDEHCGDGDQQGSGGSPRLINEIASTSVVIEMDRSPKIDGQQNPNEFIRLRQSFEQPRLKAPSRTNECPAVAYLPHAERCPKADKYPGTYRQSDKSSRPWKAPDGLVPSRSHSEGHSLANVKDESMQDIAKLVSLKTKLPEVKEDVTEDVSKVHHFVHNKTPMLSLKYLMGKGFHFKENHAKFLSINLLHILKFLLDRHIIHADISPEKIVFNNKGYPCLTGYEKSEIIGGCRRDSKFTIPKIEFCSPEQFCKKDEITEATDVFSTGVLVYRMLYGRSPHKDVNYQKTKANLLRDSFIPRFKPDGILSWTGKLFIAHCIRRDPDQRFSIKRCQSSLVDSVKWFKGLDESALINQTDPSPFSQFLYKNQNTTISGTTGTSDTTGTSGTTSCAPVSNLQAMANKVFSQPASKLPTRVRTPGTTRVRTPGMVNRLSSHRPTRHRSQHIVR